MSTSSGCAISSRNPPKCGALKNSVVNDADIAQRPDGFSQLSQNGVVPPRLTGHQQLADELRGSDQRQCLSDGRRDRLLAEHRQPGNSASVFTAWCAGGTVTSMTAWACDSAMTSAMRITHHHRQPAIADGPPREVKVEIDDTDQLDFGGVVPITSSQCCPMFPAPTSTTRIGDSVAMVANEFIRHPIGCASHLGSRVR